ncbi:MAG: DUF4832 domain-containing protein [Fibrella sp.]|nr:DUF4832 domain-containing protein [Armatimonadota bacterium]
MSNKKSINFVTLRTAALLAGVASLLVIGVTEAAIPPNASYHGLTDTAQAPFPAPLKGLVSFYENEPTSHPHSLEWVYWKLSDVVVGVDGSGNNTYDWSRFDSALDNVARRGHQACVRFYTYYPEDPPRAGAMPSFLNPATFSWRGSLGTEYAPNFNDPNVVKCLTQFITALGNRYDHPTVNSRIAFLTAGLIGFWGEWHAYTDEPGWNESAVLNDDTKGQIARKFQDSFQNIPVLLRYPLSSQAQSYGANPFKFGYHDDSFAFATTGSVAWYFQPKLSAAGLLNSGNEIWLTKPIGGEIYPPSQGDVFRSGSQNNYNWNAGLAALHPTWMMAEKYMASNPTPASADYQNGVDASAAMGYNIRVHAAYFPNSTSRNSNMYLGVIFTNSGLAPLFHKWNLQMGLRNQSTGTVTTWDTNWDLRTVRPDWQDYLFEYTTSSTPASRGLGAGVYDVCVKHRNPLEGTYPNALPFRFGTQGQGADGWMKVGTVSLTN